MLVSLVACTSSFNLRHSRIRVSVGDRIVITLDEEQEQVLKGLHELLTEDGREIYPGTPPVMTLIMLMRAINRHWEKHGPHPIIEVHTRRDQIVVTHTYTKRTEGLDRTAIPMVALCLPQTRH